METDKKQLIKIVGICLLGMLMFGGAGAYLLFGNDPSVTRNEMILYGGIAGFLMLLCIGAAALFIVSYKKKKPLYRVSIEGRCPRRWRSGDGCFIGAP